MKVLVTGATGFVGSHAAAEIAHAGHAVRVLARAPEKVERVLRPLGVHTEDVVIGDMTDATAVSKALDSCDAVLHAAAAVAVTGADNHAVVEANVVGTEHVVGGAAARGLDPILYVSSVAVFVPPSSARIGVDSPLVEPHNPYGVSKVRAERFVRSLQDAGAPVTIVYPGGVYGPRAPSLDAGLEGLKSALELAWPVVDGGITVVDVRDLATAFASALEPGHGARRLMLGGRYLCWRDFAQLCADITGRAPRRLVLPAPALRTLGWLLDQAKKWVPFDYALTRDAALFMTTLVPTEDQASLTALGLELRPTRETIEDSLRWMLEAGHLSPAYAPRLRGLA